MTTAPLPTQFNTYRATLVTVHDGDTMHFSLALGFGFFWAGRCRLARCNAPELLLPNGTPNPAGTAARDFATAWLPIAPNALVIVSDHPDNYGRPLVEVWRVSDGHNLSDDLLAAGMAIPMKGEETYG